MEENFKNKPIRIAIHQPNFFPRLKVLQKLAYADIWCVLDSVQFCTREWQNRTQIIPEHGIGDPFWFTLPISRPKGRNSLINEVFISDSDYLNKFLEKTLLHSFRLTPFWGIILDLIESLKPNLKTNNLTNICVDITRTLLKIANRNPKIIYSSELPVNGKSSTLISNLCNYLKSDTYLADSGAYNYLIADHFRDIEVLWQNWNEPIEKWNNINSWRNISSLNYLSRVGPELYSKHLLSSEFNNDFLWKKSITQNIF